MHQEDTHTKRDEKSLHTKHLRSMSTNIVSRDQQECMCRQITKIYQNKILSTVMCHKS